jgi:hypothetical protein
MELQKANPSLIILHSIFTWNWICIILEQMEGASERLSPTKAPASDLTPIRQMTAFTTPRC